MSVLRLIFISTKPPDSGGFATQNIRFSTQNLRRMSGLMSAYAQLHPLDATKMLRVTFTIMNAIPFKGIIYITIRLFVKDFQTIFSLHLICPYHLVCKPLLYFSAYFLDGLSRIETAASQPLGFRTQLLVPAVVGTTYPKRENQSLNAQSNTFLLSDTAGQ